MAILVILSVSSSSFLPLDLDIFQELMNAGEGFLDESFYEFFLSIPRRRSEVR